jgi:hypothetical protein
MGPAGKGGKKLLPPGEAGLYWWVPTVCRDSCNVGTHEVGLRRKSAASSSISVYRWSRRRRVRLFAIHVNVNVQTNLNRLDPDRIHVERLLPRLLLTSEDQENGNAAAPLHSTHPPASHFGGSRFRVFLNSNDP